MKMNLTCIAVTLPSEASKKSATISLYFLFKFQLTLLDLKKCFDFLQIKCTNLFLLLFKFQLKLVKCKK
jgi:hypothetical protein